MSPRVKAKPGSAGESFDAFAEDVLGERGARALVIVGSSKIDSLLVEILDRYCLPKLAKTQDQDELLEGDRPLATFSARMKMCYRLGLIDGTLYSTLDTLRVLRNASAHSLKFDLSQSPAREHLGELRRKLLPRQSCRLTMERYFDQAATRPFQELQCFLLTLCVLLEAIRERIRRTSGNQNALRISAK